MREGCDETMVRRFCERRRVCGVVVIRVAWVLLSGWLAAGRAGGAEPVWLKAGPMLGHVGPDEARVWVKTSGAATVRVICGEDSRLEVATHRAVARADPAEDFSATVRIPELVPGRRYYYRVDVDGEAANVRPYPSFVTAPRVEEEKQVRFGFSSCVGKAGFLDAAAWADMARTNMSFFLMLGDNHYADTAEATGQRAGYLGHRSQPSFVAFGARVPLYGIWDDHDFGVNDSDGTTPGKEIALRTFREHWPNPGFGQPDDPGVYFRFRRGGAEFFMLDGRYHRSPNKAKEDGSKTMLGARQLAWLKEGLKGSTAAVKFVACGSEWQSRSTEDSWTSFQREKADLFGFLRQEGIEGVVFLSGDRHFTAAYQVEGRWLEVTSGPLGSASVKPRDNPEMFLGYGDGRYYSIFDLNTAGSEPELILEVYRVGDGLQTVRKFNWSEITGRASVVKPEKVIP